MDKTFIIKVFWFLGISLRKWKKVTLVDINYMPSTSLYYISLSLGFGNIEI